MQKGKRQSSKKYEDANVCKQNKIFFFPKGYGKLLMDFE